MSQLKKKEPAQETEMVQPGRWEEGQLKPRNGRVSRDEGVAESDVNGSNNRAGGGLRAEQQDLRNSRQAALLEDRLAEDTTGEVRGGAAESPAGAAIRMDHEEVSMSEESQGRGQNAEG